MQSESMPPSPLGPSTSPTTKRRISTLDGSISPPPLKRKKTLPHEPIKATSPTSTLTSKKSLDGEKSQEQAGTGTRNNNTHIEILSWNVNGLTHLLQPSTQKITSFFHTATITRKKANGEFYDSEDEKMHHEERRRGNNAISPMREFLKRHNWPHIVGLQEVKVASSEKERMERALEKAANSEEEDVVRIGPKYQVIMSLPRDRYNAKGFGGRGRVHGVCSLVRTDLGNCDSIPGTKKVATKGVDWDLEGRVLITEIINQDPMNDDDSWKLAVFNGYWPNGTSNPYRSPTSGEIIGTRHYFKRSFHERILAEVKTYQEDNWHVLLVGDMNIAPQRIDGFPNLRLGTEHVRNRADFNNKFLEGDNLDGMRGVDTFRWVRGHQMKYSYHGERPEQWGVNCDRVDLGIVSRGVVERGALVDAEIWDSVEERGGSDHVPIGVVIDIGKLGMVSMEEGQEERIASYLQMDSD